MRPAKFFKRLRELYAANVALSERKNHDYSGNVDAMANFMAIESLGVSAEQALLVRINDKVMRIANGLKGELKVRDESILDTLSDLANYAMLLRIVIEYKKEHNGIPF